MITDNRDGTVRFEYDLNVVPCIKCGGTNIKLFENGGKTYYEDVKKASGGGICNKCGYTVMEFNLPTCPTMTMILEVWNINN